MNAGSEDPNSLRNEVFSRVFDENWAFVRHHIECVVDDDAEVTELVSEVFLTAWGRLKPHRPLQRAELLRVADRVVRRRRRGIADRPAVTEAVHAGVAHPETEDSTASHSEILSALSGLRARERRIIMLTHWDGLSWGEAVEALGVSHRRAEAIFRRAHTKLRGRLGLEGASFAADH